jgi:hypothetical protein
MKYFDQSMWPFIRQVYAVGKRNVKAFHKTGVCRRPDECKGPFIRQVYAVGKRNVKAFHKAGVCSRPKECEGLS